MASRHYKLVYWDARGRAESIRWLFAYAGQDWEDVRLPAGQLGRACAQAPLGGVPYLEVDRRPLGDVAAICRHLAHQFGLGLTGKDAWQAAQMDSVVEFIHETARPLYAWIDRRILGKPAQGDPAPEVLISNVAAPVRQLEGILLKNSGGDRFLMGREPSWTDFVLGSFLENLQTVDTDFLEMRPVLEAYFARVCGLKGVAHWLERRPPTAY
ncbi:probable glutathione S-transferase 9 [Paramacrobiotus metropolitanus]|uniref:probable glutathione S-transferase 9 n=1 Tax=Paramacrobiotus metropolitanus TaxID=2943436 RepID=UPI002445BF14|nr:probable glutathione S-transferase 9 [Paramacrobiotus metropolitanus]